MKRLICTKSMYLSIAVLFLLYFVCPIKIRQLSGTPYDSIAMGYIHRTVGLVFWGVVLCVYPTVLNRVSTSSRNKVVLARLSIAFAVLIGGTSVYNSLPSVRASRILRGAQFAPLPKSTSELKVLAWYTPMSGEEYIRFRASSADISSFIEQSPILEHVECEEYSETRMRLFFSSRPGSSSSHDNHQYINEKPTAPAWYMQEIRDDAMRYRFVPKGYDHANELIVDQKNNTIFIEMVIG